MDDIEVRAPTTPNDKKKETKQTAWLPSLEEVFKWAPFQLPVTKSLRKNKDDMPVLSVQVVLGWALLGAVCVALTFLIAILFANIPIPCSENSQGPWWMMECPDLTPAQEVEVDFCTAGFMWFTVPQAAAATVGLMLPRRRARSRWSLAFLALLSAGTAHYMLARSTLVFIAANPGDILFRVLGCGGAVGYVAGDVLCIISLLIGGTDKQ